MAEIKDVERIMKLHLSHTKELNGVKDFIFVDGEDSVLLAMLYEDRDLLSGDLVTKTGLTSGRVANILKKLEQKKLIVRANDAEDKRKVHVHMTESGLSRATKLNDEIKRKYQNVLTYFGEKDTSAAIHLMERIIEYCDDPERAVT